MRREEGKTTMETKELSELFASLTDEQKERVRVCKDGRSLAKTLEELGVELPDTLLDEVAGGNGQNPVTWGPEYAVNFLTSMLMEQNPGMSVETATRIAKESVLGISS